MKNKIISFILSFVLPCFGSFAQTSAKIPGIWKGTSICQIKNSPCHDENVVYHISKTGSTNLFEAQASKIVDNKEVDMGTLKFTYDPQKQTLTSIDSIRNATWVFNLEGKQIKGTLVYKNNLFRVIDLKKED